MAHGHSMKLAEKGRYAPPPALEANAQRVAQTLATWPGVHARTHWLLGDENEVDGADFYVGEDEVGHIHLDSEAHVFAGKELARALIESGLARRFEWSAEAVVFEIRRRSDVRHALWLFDLSYRRRRGLSVAALLRRVEEYATQESVEASG